MEQSIQVFKEKKGNRILKIYQDMNEDEEESPRNWDNVGKMICFHREYKLGDKTDLTSNIFDSWKEL